MTPEQRIKQEILTRAIAENEDISFEGDVTSENVDELYESLLIDEDCHWDYESDFRGGQIETDIKTESSRHYESKAVAAKLSDGTWIGWTYWYGGGKHGEPESIDWMSEAYELDVTEEEKLVTVRTFKKRETVSG